MTLLAFILIVAALLMLASAMHRHQKDRVFKHLLSLGYPRVRRLTGFAILLTAFLSLLLELTWAYALVNWLGLLSLGSVSVALLAAFGNKK